MRENEHTHTNGEITVVWKPHIAKHSGVCARGLYRDFNPKARRSVSMASATTEQSAVQVQKCPSGALTLIRNEDFKV